MQRAIRRVRQGLRALAAFARPVDETAAAALLSPALMHLFRRMTRAEQQHSLRVMRTLRAQGYTDPDLLTAALLHDVGKSRYGLNLVERTLVVLIEALWPGRAAHWSRGAPSGWRRAFVIKAQHPVWSAEDMAAAGASARACTIARRHQERIDPEDTGEMAELVRALQVADDIN